jgi:hypothetical protein
MKSSSDGNERVILSYCIMKDVLNYSISEQRMVGFVEWFAVCYFVLKYEIFL